MIKIKKLWKEEGKTCYYCKCDTHVPKIKNGKVILKKDSATREHLIPKIHGGKNSRINIKLACHRCNALRGNMYAVDWMIIAKNPASLKSYLNDKAEAKRIKKRAKKDKLARRYREEIRVGYIVRHRSLPMLEFVQLFGEAA